MPHFVPIHSVYRIVVDGCVTVQNEQCKAHRREVRQQMRPITGQRTPLPVVVQQVIQQNSHVSCRHRQRIVHNAYVQ